MKKGREMQALFVTVHHLKKDSEVQDLLYTV